MRFTAYGLVMILLGIMLAFFNQTIIISAEALDGWGFDYQRYWIVLDYEDDGHRILDFYGTAMAIYGLVILCVGHKRRNNVNRIKPFRAMLPILPVLLAAVALIPVETWSALMGRDPRYTAPLLGNIPFMGMMIAGFASLHLLVTTLKLPR